MSSLSEKMAQLAEVTALTRLEGRRSWCRYCLRYHVLWIFKMCGDGWRSLSLSYSRQDGGEKMTLGVEVSAVEWWQGSRRRTRRYGLPDLPWSIMNKWCIFNAPFFAILFRDSVGEHDRVQIRLYNPCPVGRSVGCTSGFARKLVRFEHCLGEWT